eukprot:TRINITY_DN4836_c0_g1_i1.p1 TRINITY_DN4836_c0_g1~~TRINITY_DN4836_c0_g1_i1.p1  ORF type:complete len:353 (-),score=101.72 TRINITY_DN4836_c0_g1_i1:184-1209(-)
MPSITWHKHPAGADCEGNSAADAKTEEGKVTVLAKLLFVNGTKKRKLSDLGSVPERAGQGQVVLRFDDKQWCSVQFDKKQEADDFEHLVLNAMGGKLATAALGGGASPLEEAVRAAMARASVGQAFANPLPAKMPRGSKPGQVSQLVFDLCQAWEAADAKRDQASREKVASLEAQRNEEQRIRKKVEDDHRQVDLRLSAAEASNAGLEKTLSFMKEEVAMTKKLLADSERADPKTLRYLEEEIASLRSRLKEVWHGNVSGYQPPPRPPLQQQLSHARPSNMAKAIAEFEAAALSKSSEADRAAIKKKLLLKWHPDKQPSAEHSELSKQVMQELQNLPCWAS